MSNHLIHLLQTENIPIVEETLHFFLEECSLDESPSHDEVAHWQHILTQRGGKFQRLATMCANWIKENQNATE